MKNDTLTADSEIYSQKSDVYEKYSQAEDYPKKVSNFLAHEIRDKIVLDFGCGTGKFIPDLAPLAKQYIATDISDGQLTIARKKSEGFNNVSIIKTEKGALSFDDDAIDVIVSAWVIGSIHDLNTRGKILEEFKRVLRPGGKVLLIENDLNGEFKEILETNENTQAKLKWLNENNFWEVQHIETYFEFSDLDTTRNVFSQIYDDEIGNKITKNTISHNVVILEYSPNLVLDSTKYVVDNAQYVRINQSKLSEFIDNFKLQEESNWLKDPPFDIENLNDEQKLMVSVVFNAISFSYWGEPYWNVEYKGILHTRGSWSLMASIFRSTEEGKNLLDSVILSSITKEELAVALRGNTQIPLLEERKNILNRIGKVLLEKYNGKFSNVVLESKGDALVLVDMILNVFSPSFDDSYSYKGKRIYFNKRAQALVESINSIFEGKRYGKFSNMDSLTALADYIIPNILRSAGVIQYTDELAGIIDKKELIEKGSEYEVEIRASVVWVVEYIRRGLLKKGIRVSSKSINDYLWTKGGNATTPFHQTRTTAY